jgi:hypothetical protein
MPGPSVDAIFEQCGGQSFYLEMMRLNAIRDDAPSRLHEIVRGSAAVSGDDVIQLLRSHWRHRVAGAWIAIAKSDSDVATAVLHALRTSSGSLDAPPLAVAAALLAGAASRSSLLEYWRQDQQHDSGAADFVAAAIEYVSGDGDASESGTPDAEARNSFRAMRELALELHRLGSA